MLLALFLLVVLLLTAAGVWFHGLWGNVVTLGNMLISAMVATTFYEPVTVKLLDVTSNDYSYVADFLVLWGLFAITFGILRLITDMISRKRLKFHPMTETVGRSVMALVVGYVMMMFTAFTVHTAPIQEEPFNGALSSGSPTFLFMSPDQQWIGFVRGQSKMGLAGRSIFDENGEWASDHAERRRAFEAEEGFLAQ